MPGVPSPAVRRAFFCSPCGSPPGWLSPFRGILRAEGDEMMQRRTDCENVILSAKEKKLLKKIQRHPHRKCSNQEIHTLKIMGLVTPDTCGVDAFNAPIPTGT